MKNFSVNLQSQRARLLEWLRSSTITTLEAREQLDILHPAARIKELREDGYKIVTCIVFERTPYAQHKVARYVLLNEVP